MKLLYLHGLGSTPGGAKATFLRSQGFEVVTPALPDEDFGTVFTMVQRWNLDDFLKEKRPEQLVYPTA